MTNPKTVLVTGASRGIGFLTAKLLAENGYRVYASMRNITGQNKKISDELTLWADENKVLLEPIELDVTSDISVQQAIEKIEQKYTIDILINNAGVMPTGLTEAYSLEQVQTFFDVNLYGVIRTCQAVLPHMRERKSGLLINLSSAAGRFAIPYFGVYCASKWAMEAYCETLHYELEAFGIESVLIEPSGHGTDLVKTAPAPADNHRLSEYGVLAGGREKLLGSFQAMFEQGDRATDAVNVATSILQLINADGPRPIRTQVGHDMGVQALNDASAPIQAALIEGLKPIYSPA
ncbi:SDR family oxidoreductase [Sneathiella glossodoripedis]|uniref:SDR family oxidoreductase n=1 Tax=Sneathiella glossodoripedis TaxID=418853 RepID=UPI00046FE845|nr:SDR family oxidoreductase [Sneathiella glossodoripedis]